MTKVTDVAVIGAGPYGLSISAHLSASGIEHRVFGTPMQTWLSMPKGMALKSLDFATNIYTPRPGYRLTDYCRDRGLCSGEPLPIDLFARYGLWAQTQLVPQLEKVDVVKLSQPNGTFSIELATGEQLSARRAVVATGIRYFPRLPESLAGLPRELVTHTSDHVEYDEYRGREVAVLGAGQSALEAAVLLHEAGARPTLIVRGEDAYFAPPPPERWRLKDKIKMPMSVLGPSRLGYFLEHVPFALHYLPDKRRVAMTRKHWGPWGSWWLAPRFRGNVPVLPRNEIASAAPRGSRLALTLRNRTTGSEHELVVDHLVAGTGYEPDLERLPFMDAMLLNRIRRIERTAKLSANFESSVPGLYFVGAASAFSFGPLVRFVCGAEFTAPTVTRHLARGLVGSLAGAAVAVQAP